MNFVYLCFISYVFVVSFVHRTHSSISNSSSAYDSTKRLSDKLLDQKNNTEISVGASDYGEFQLIQSNVLQVKNHQTRSKRDSETSQNSTSIISLSQDDTTQMRSRNDKKYKHDKKKKKKKGGLYSLMKKWKKKIPKFLKKMMPMMKGPGMFMMGMAQANLHNFVMHALMMSKMALGSVIMMIIRELVFGDKDEPVKYYNFGYDTPPRRRIITTIEHPVYKRRRRRHT